MDYFNIKIYKVFFLYVLIIWLINIILVPLNGGPLIIPIFVIIYLIALYRDINYSISFFLYFVPLTSIIGTEFNLFQLLGFNEIAQLGILYFIIRKKRNEKKKTPIIMQQLQNILLVIFVFWLIFTLKSIVFPNIFTKNVHNISYFFKTFFKLSLNYIPMMILIKYIVRDDIVKYIIPAILFSALTIAISMPFSSTLDNAGFDIQKVVFDRSVKEFVLSRAAGFYGAGGDVNSAGLFLSVVLAFILSIGKYTVKYYKQMNIIILFIIMGVLYTASRTSVIATALVILMFIYSEGKISKRIFSLILTLSSSIVIFYPVFVGAIKRFFLDSAMAAVDPNELGRLGKWLLYFDFFSTRQFSVFLGYLSPINTIQVPHNGFINILYNAGILVLIPFIYYLIVIFRWFFKRRRLSSIYIALIPFFGALMTVNTLNSGILLWIILAVNVRMMRDSSQLLIK